VRTFSKIYGLAGLRVGYGIGRAEVIDLLNRVRQPFNVNNLALAGALAALDDHEFLAAAMSRIAAAWNRSSRD
jgi:histidinol-phosphate aminotransferase